MKKLFLIVLAFLVFAQSYSQDKVTDLSGSICTCVEQTKDLDDSALVKHCFDMAISTTPNLPKSESQLMNLLSKVHLNLQRTCNRYIEIMNRIVPKKGDWVLLQSNLSSKLDSSQCRELFKHDKLYYFEATGDTTWVTVKDGFWTEAFKGGKYYSKCKFRWKSSTDFEIEFVKSNEPIRSKLSNKGDVYTYRVIENKDNYYVLTANYGATYQLFKVYF